MYNFCEKKEENKSNDLPSQNFYFPIFFKFLYVVFKFSIGNLSID